MLLPVHPTTAGTTPQPNAFALDKHRLVYSVRNRCQELFCDSHKILRGSYQVAAAEIERPGQAVCAAE